MLHAFREPSVQQRSTSAVQPLSSMRASGRPMIATPRTSSPSDTATHTIAPTTGLWCRWCFSTKVLASRCVIGESSSMLRRQRLYIAHQVCHAPARRAADLHRLRQLALRHLAPQRGFADREHAGGFGGGDEDWGERLSGVHVASPLLTVSSLLNSITHTHGDR